MRKLYKLGLIILFFIGSLLFVSSKVYANILAKMDQYVYEDVRVGDMLDADVSLYNNSGDTVSGKFDFAVDSNFQIVEGCVDETFTLENGKTKNSPCKVKVLEAIPDTTVSLRFDDLTHNDWNRIWLYINYAQESTDPGPSDPEPEPENTTPSTPNTPEPEPESEQETETPQTEEPPATESETEEVTEEAAPEQDTTSTKETKIGIEYIILCVSCPTLLLLLLLFIFVLIRHKKRKAKGKNKA